MQFYCLDICAYVKYSKQFAMTKRHKLFSSIVGTAVAIFGTVIASRGVHDSFLFAKNRRAVANYSISLTEANKYRTGEVSKEITTDSGAYQVEFAYYNCSPLGGGHVTINNEGTVKNTDHILSIESITPVFTCESSVSLKFRASYDSKKWGEYATLTSGKTFSFDSNPFYIELKAFGGAVNLSSFKFTYSCQDTQDIEHAFEEWTLVKSDSEIAVDGKYIIVSADTNQALSTTQNTNNRSGTSIIKSTDGTKVEINDSVQILTLVNGVDEYYAFSTGDGYLAAQTAASNYLWTNDNIDANSSWKISIDEEDYHSSIQSRTSGGRDTIFYNPNSSGNYTIFSCYSSSSTMGLVNLFKLTGNIVGIPKYVTGIDATDEKASNYHISDVFNNFIDNGGLNVKLHYSDGKSEALNKDNYTVTIKNSSGAAVSSTTGFVSNGTYSVTITDKTYGFSYTYQILVANNPVTSITLNSTSLRLGVEETAQLTVTSIVPENADDKTITWTSSDENVAIVSASGLVAARSGGTATITATANGGSGVTASCTVKVSSAQGGGAETINATFDFTNISDFSSWGNSYSEHVVSSNDNGTVTFASASRQTGTITNMPISKGGDVYYVAPKDSFITNIDFVCEKWGSKSNFYILYTSTNGGTTFTKTNYETGSSSYSLSVSDLGEDINAIKFVGNSTSNQIGIKSLDLVLVKPSSVVIPVTSFSVSPATKSILVNDDFTIGATILPTDATNKKIIWVSSNEEVATVADGVVTAISAGKATITATVKDTAFSATCTVTVNNRPVTLLELSKTEAEITVGKDLQLTATINDDATVQTLVWESSDESVLTVDSSGKVHAVSEGSAIVTVTADGGVTATCSIAVIPKQEGGGGSVEEGTRLFFEPFTGFSASAKPTALGTNGEVYNDASVSYTCNNGGSDTKIYAESLAGGTSPEILVSKNGGSFVISGLPTAGAEELSFTYKHNNTNNSVTCSSAAYSVNGNSGSYILALKSGQTAPEAITITIANSAGSNTRRLLSRSDRTWRRRRYPPAPPSCRSRRRASRSDPCCRRSATPTSP